MQLKIETAQKRFENGGEADFGKVDTDRFQMILDNFRDDFIADIDNEMEQLEQLMASHNAMN